MPAIATATGVPTQYTSAPNTPGPHDSLTFFICFALFCVLLGAYGIFKPQLDERKRRSRLARQRRELVEAYMSSIEVVVDPRVQSLESPLPESVSEKILASSPPSNDVKVEEASEKHQSIETQVGVVPSIVLFTPEGVATEPKVFVLPARKVDDFGLEALLEEDDSFGSIESGDDSLDLDFETVGLGSDVDVDEVLLSPTLTLPEAVEILPCVTGLVIIPRIVLTSPEGTDTEPEFFVPQQDDADIGEEDDSFDSVASDEKSLDLDVAASYSGEDIEEEDCDEEEDEEEEKFTFSTPILSGLELPEEDNVVPIASTSAIPTPSFHGSLSYSGSSFNLASLASGPADASDDTDVGDLSSNDVLASSSSAQDFVEGTKSPPMAALLRTYIEGNGLGSFGKPGGRPRRQTRWVAPGPSRLRNICIPEEHADEKTEDKEQSLLEPIPEDPSIGGFAMSTSYSCLNLGQLCSSPPRATFKAKAASSPSSVRQTDKENNSLLAT